MDRTPDLLPQFAGTLPASRVREVTELRRARLSDAIPFQGQTPRARGSARQGQLYEKRVVAALEKKYGNVISGAWFEGEDKQGSFMCQPDVILPLPTCTVIAEVKLTHHLNAWRQLNLLYAPVVEHCFPGRPCVLVEICRNFNRAVHFPGPSYLVTDIEEALMYEVFTSSPTNGTGVYQWRP